MEQRCTICNREIQNLPTIELLCHHRCHTFCFLNNIQTANTNNQLHFLACVSCETPVFAREQQEHAADPPEDEEPDFTEHDEEELFDEQIEDDHTETYLDEYSRVENLYETNDEFRKDIKKYMTSLRAYSKPRKEFVKIVTTKKAEVQSRYEQIKALYEGLYETKKSEIKNTPEYKNFKKASASMMRYWYILGNKYNLRGLSLAALRNKRGCRAIRKPYRYWRDNPQHIIRHALRLRLPFR